MKKFSYTVLVTGTEQGPLTGETTDAFRSMLSSLIQSSAMELQKIRGEVIQKNGTILRGGLTQFLSTPLKSDKDEIIKLIEDSIENSVQQLDAAPMLGTVEQSLWTIVDPQDVPLHRTAVGAVKRMLKEGKTMLANAGCSFGKNAAPTIITRFLFNGFSTILPLQRIIDQSSEQHQLTQVNNVVHSITASTERTGENGYLLLIDLDVKDFSQIETILPEIQNACERNGGQGFTCALQTFHSRVGSLLQFSCMIDIEKQPIGSLISAVAEVHPEVKTAMNNGGTLVIVKTLP